MLFTIVMLKAVTNLMTRNRKHEIEEVADDVNIIGKNKKKD